MSGNVVSGNVVSGTANIVDNVQTGAPVPTQPSPGQPSRARRMFWPVTGIAGLIGASAYIGMVDPNQAGHYPLCPLKYLMGADCPGCGGLRSVHSLMHGDVVGAVDHNLLVVLAFPIAIVWLTLLLIARWRGQPIAGSTWVRKWATPLAYAAVALVVVFTIARNLSFVPFLDSGLS